MQDRYFARTCASCVFRRYSLAHVDQASASRPRPCRRPLKGPPLGPLTVPVVLFSPMRPRRIRRSGDPSKRVGKTADRRAHSLTELGPRRPPDGENCFRALQLATRRQHGHPEEKANRSLSRNAPPMTPDLWRSVCVYCSRESW